MTDHPGRERMEASTWRPSYGPRGPRLRSDPRLLTALWLVVLGSLLVAFVLTSAALVDMNRTYPPVIEGRTEWSVRFHAVDPDTGAAVSRDQWISEATR